MKRGARYVFGVCVSETLVRQGGVIGVALV